jgi:predicted MFS family arabinose efflux permease
MTKKLNSGKVITLILMILAMNTIYLLPYLMYTYYTPLQEAMGLVGRDADYGMLLNVYGIANVILYLPGGWIADKFDCKKLLVFSMISTGVLGIWEATWPSYTLLLIIHIMFAVTTVLTFWSSSVKCVNMLADDGEQGGMFGSLEAGRGVVGLILTVIFTSIYAANAADSGKAMSLVVFIISIVMIAIGVALAFLMPKPKNNEGATNESLIDSIKAMGVAFKCPTTYLLAGMIFCGSMTLASTTYFAPYLQNVCELPVTIGVMFSNYSKIICQLIGATLAAFLATKLKRSSKPMIWAGFIGVICFVIMAMLPASTVVMWPMLVIMVIALMIIYVFRALYYAVVDEAGTPKNIVGSVIGIASLLGFLPDTFYTTLCGKWLEADPVGGYKKIFISCICAVVLGLVCAFIVDKKITKHRAENAE